MSIISTTVEVKYRVGLTFDESNEKVINILVRHCGDTINAAIAAMQGLLTAIISQPLLTEQYYLYAKKEGKSVGESIAEYAVGYADALIKELEERK